MTEQLEEWRGEFGRAYTERSQPTEAATAGIAAAFGPVVGHMAAAPPRSILEVGANVGRTLGGMARVTDAELWALEPNEVARAGLAASGILPPERIVDGHAGDIPLDDGAVDLAYTSGVLIHVPPDAIEAALDEIHRVARRWVLCCEYFAPAERAITYRGRGDLLWNRDYGSLWMDRFDDLEPVAYGFFWRRLTPFDDTTWWLFRKDG